MGHSGLTDFTGTTHPTSLTLLCGSEPYPLPWRWLSVCSQAFAFFSLSFLGCVFISILLLVGRKASVVSQSRRYLQWKIKETEGEGEKGERKEDVKGREDRGRRGRNTQFFSSIYFNFQYYCSCVSCPLLIKISMHIYISQTLCCCNKLIINF